MLNNFSLLKAFQYIDEKDIEAAAVSMGYCGSKPAKHHKKFWRTAMLAAVIACLLVVTALAVGLSIHARRQQEINDKLQIDRNMATGYKEYDVSAESELGLTVLSCKYDGEAYTMYLDYSPVTMEELEEMVNDPQDNFVPAVWGCKIGNSDIIYPAFPYTQDWNFALQDCLEPEIDSTGHEFVYPKPEAKLKKLIEQCYDEESRTLTLVVNAVTSEALEDEVEISFGKIINKGEFALDELCRTKISPAEYQPKILYFPEPVEIIEEESGMDFTFIGAELSSTGCLWYIKSSGAENALDYSDFESATEEEKSEFTKYQSFWLNALARVERSCFLNFKDGSRMELSGENSSEYKDGIVKPYCTWADKTINAEEVESISICGNTVKIADCKDKP